MLPELRRSHYFPHPFWVGTVRRPGPERSVRAPLSLPS